MITRTKQVWEVGKVVKVGFLTLTILETNIFNNQGPNKYLLESSKGIKYFFTPHFGLEKV
jgi:hypothetical protein